MPLPAFLGSIVSWLRAGYPEGVPESDYIPLLAVLSRRLSNDEVRAVTQELIASGELEILRVSHEVELEQREVLAARRAARDDVLVRRTLAELRTAAQSSSGNLVPPMLAAARAEATLGEICDVLRDEWGTYTETARF